MFLPSQPSIFLTASAVLKGEELMKTLRLFTLNEANSLLPEIESVLGRVSEKRKKCEKLHDLFFVRELIAEALPSDRETMLLEDDALHLDTLMDEIEKDVSVLKQIGCRVRNLESGCVDFFSEHEGKPVYFCWVRGEEQIRHYHLPEDPDSRRFFS